MVILLVDEIVRPLRSEEKEVRKAFPIRLENNAPRHHRGERYVGFPVLRRVGADLQHEEGWRNAGAKYRSGC